MPLVNTSYGTAIKAESRALKVLLIQRGMKHTALAEMVEYPPGQVANLLCGNSYSWPLRAAINKALQKKIFSKPPITRRRVRHTITKGQHAH